MFEHIVDAAEGAFLMGAGIFLYLTVKKGVPWAYTTLKGWWTAGKADLAKAKTDISGLQGDVAALKTEMAQVKAKVGA